MNGTNGAEPLAGTHSVDSVAAADDDYWMTKEELAEWLRVSVRTIEEKVASGVLPVDELLGEKLPRFFKPAIREAMAASRKFRKRKVPAVEVAVEIYGTATTQRVSRREPMEGRAA